MNIRFVAVVVGTLLTVGSSGRAFAQVPAEVLDLRAWKLTLPYDTSRKGNPDEVTQPELKSFADASCFFVSEAKQAVVFRAVCGGLGTENSKYPRSELREMKADGKDEMEWSTKGTEERVLVVKQAITHTPDVKRHVVCAQIHDADNDLIMVRLENSKLIVERNGADDVLLDKEYRLGEPFQLRIVAGGGRVQLWYNEVRKMDWKIDRSGCYFKVGCYTQSNVKKGDKPTAYGEVEVYELSVQ